MEKQRADLLRSLRGIRRMIRGSYGMTYRRCGRPTCWCMQDEKGHPYHRITWTKNAIPGTKAIPREDVSWIKEMTGNYRRYQELKTRLREKEQELRISLNKLEEEIILRTKKLRKYL